MLDFVNSFIDFITTVWTLIYQFICDIPMFLKTYWDILSVLPSYLNIFLPSGLLITFESMVVFAVLFKILGREG